MRQRFTMYLSVCVLGLQALAIGALAADFTEATDPIIATCKRLVASPRHSYQTGKYPFLKDAKFCRCVKSARVDGMIEANAQSDPSFREQAKMMRPSLAVQTSIRFKRQSAEVQEAQVDEDIDAVMTIAVSERDKYAKMKCTYE